MSTHIELLPTDTLLDVATHLALPQILNFVQVSSKFWKLGHSRTLWLETLKRTQETLPLACLIGTDLDQLDRDELCRIAHRTNRLDRFWATVSPGSVHPVRTLSLGFSCLEEGERVEILAAIPGTTMIVIHAREICRKVFCWDIASANSILVEDGIPVRSEYFSRVHYDEYGCHRMAAASGEERKLCIIEVTYGDGKVPKMQEIFRRDLPFTDPWISGFLVQDAVGYFLSGDNGQHSILVINFVQDTAYSIPVDVTPTRTMSVNSPCFDTIGNTPYMSFSDSFEQSGVIVYRIPPELLFSRIGSGAPVGEATVEVILDLEPLEIDDWFLLEPLCSPVGLQALLRDLTDDQFPSTHAYLQPVDWDRRIRPDTASTTVRLDGDMEIHAWSASGTQAAVILDRRAVYGSNIEPEPPVTLALLRFSARGIDAQDLVLPEGLKGDAVIDSVAIDERSGVVYLGTPARLFVLRFA